MTAAAVAPVTGFRGEHGLISTDDVEARLIEARRTFDRLAGGGGGWATDGPWYLSRAKAATVDVTDAVVGALELGESLERVLRDPRPDRDMIRRAEEAAAWMPLIPTDKDRMLVNDVIGDLAARGQVNWSRMLKRMGMVRGKAGLEKRYKRALFCLANRLNG